MVAGRGKPLIMRSYAFGQEFNARVWGIREPKADEAMSQVNVTINGRQFRMACEDGQEDHLRQLAKELDERIVALRGQFGEIGDARLTVMAALMVADELAETGKKLEAAGGRPRRAAGRPRRRRRSARQATQAAIVAAFNSAAERIEDMAKKLSQTGGGGNSVAQG